MAANNGNLADRALLGSFSQNRNRAALGASLIESGLTQMGNPGAGKAVADYLRNEWWRKEAETFNATVGKDAQGKLTSTMDLYKKQTRLVTEMPTEEGQDPTTLRKGYYGSFDDSGQPDPSSFVPSDDAMGVNQHLNSAASDLIGSLQGVTTEYMDQAGQFPNNPIIGQSAQNLMQSVTGHFEGQMQAVKMADQVAAQKSKALDLEAKQRQADLEKYTMPQAKELALAKMDAATFDAKSHKLETQAEIMRGREIATLAGRDVDAMNDDDFIIEHRKHLMQIDEAAKQMDNARKTGKNILPPNINLNNLPDYLKHDAHGQGILSSFFNEERKKILQSPAIKKQLDDKAKALGAKSFEQFKAIRPDGAAEMEKSALEEQHVWDSVMDSAVKRATEYILQTGQLANSLGMDLKGRIPMPMSSKGDMPVPLFDNSTEMLKTVKPELFVDETTAAVNPPQTDSEDVWNSGDPEDPYGDPNIPDTSPISPVREKKETQTASNYADWLNTYAQNPKISPTVRRNAAKSAIRDLDVAIKGLSERQAIFGQELPEEEYNTKMSELMGLKANYAALKVDPETFVIDPDAAHTIRNVLSNISRSIDMVMQDTAEGLDHLQGNDTAKMPPGGGAPESASGIFATPQNAARGGRTMAQESGILPYWMLSPEEKQTRMQAFNDYVNQFGR